MQGTEYVGLPPEPHARMVAFAEAHGLSFVRRMADYYGDASYTLAEAPRLDAELRAIEAGLTEDAEVQRMLSTMHIVLATARARGLAVDVIAD